MYSTEKLLEMLKSEKSSIRYEACEWLRVSQESSPEIVAALEKATHDADNDVAERAKLALHAELHHQMGMKMGIIEPEEREIANNSAFASDEIKNRCPKCDAENPEGAQFCNNCGMSLSSDASLSKKKSRKTLWIILGLVGGVLILAGILCSVVIGKLSEEAKPISIVADAFMRYMETKDVDSAYALTSPNFQEQVSIENLRQLIAGDNYRFIDGYQSLKITNIKVNYGIPQTAQVSGTITYSDTNGIFSAVFEKVNDTWMISGFDYRKNIQTQP
jgi:predicted Zn-ribbon and HTH transcriptional regulator